MQRAQIFVVLAFVAAAGWAGLPRETADLTVDLATGSITAAIPSGADEMLSCDQVLYLEELELLSGSGCG